MTATMCYETAPGEQAQVDFGHFTYLTPDGHRRSLLAFVLVLSWSRTIFVEFVAKADVSTFIHCHLHAFERLGGIPQRCLFDNTKVVVLGREQGQPVWNPTFLGDFAVRLGFDLRLCQPYRAQTKGRVESGIKYVRGNFWPAVAFTDLADLKQQAAQWCDSVDHVRVHGTTGERPIDRLATEQAALLPLPSREALGSFLRESRLVGRDGFVHWERSAYSVPWHWTGRTVQIAASESRAEIWAGTERVAIHPRATRPHQRFTLPGQWTGLPRGDGRRAPEALARHQRGVTVEQRPLAVHEQLAMSGGNR